MKQRDIYERDTYELLQQVHNLSNKYQASEDYWTDLDERRLTEAAYRILQLLVTT